MARHPTGIPSAAVISFITRCKLACNMTKVRERPKHHRTVLGIAWYRDTGQEPLWPGPVSWYRLDGANVLLDQLQR